MPYPYIPSSVINGGGVVSHCHYNVIGKNEHVLAKPISVHLGSPSYSNGNKTYPVCTMCSNDLASPKRVLGCLGLSKQNLFTTSVLVLDLIRVNNIIDLI
ncbi:hypothetical protein CEXT_475431 [Caerostris extrusa]|uniref:Uncharacterized protein n=1 Tax=Caerostris extrusa TaxID=172846 RepID=A0AAV4XDF6_CAEEX|nr:hypothetical protein CEXT_475431 [Caerostris extrusa]